MTRLLKLLKLKVPSSSTEKPEERTSYPGKLIGGMPDFIPGDKVINSSASKNCLLHPEEVQLMVQRWHKLGKPKIPVREWKTVMDLKKWLNSPSDPWGRVVEDLLKVRKFLDEADG
jgi:hypothetical protein